MGVDIVGGGQQPESNDNTKVVDKTLTELEQHRLELLRRFQKVVRWERGFVGEAIPDPCTALENALEILSDAKGEERLERARLAITSAIESIAKIRNSLNSLEKVLAESSSDLKGCIAADVKAMKQREETLKEIKRDLAESLADKRQEPANVISLLTSCLEAQRTALGLDYRDSAECSEQEEIAVGIACDLLPLAKGHFRTFLDPIAKRATQQLNQQLKQQLKQLAWARLLFGEENVDRLIGSDFPKLSAHLDYLQACDEEGLSILPVVRQYDEQGYIVMVTNLSDVPELSELMSEDVPEFIETLDELSKLHNGSTPVRKPSIRTESPSVLGDLSASVRTSGKIGSNRF